MIISFDNITKRHDVPSKGSTEAKTISRFISLLGIKGREEHKKGYHGDAIMNMQAMKGSTYAFFFNNKKF